MFLDLDRFKHVNDSLGHHVGDLLLHEVADRLTDILREGDTAGRLGGDEFLILAERLNDAQGAERIAEKILHTFEAPFDIYGYDLAISTSIGISLYPVDSDSVATLIQQADTAMYQAKEHGRNKFRFFEKSLSDKASKRLSIASELRQAIRQDQLKAYYQPQYDLSSGKLVGAEALVRWQHPQNGLISPADFLPVAEETGLIVPLGEWMLNQACEQFQSWRSQGYSPGVLAINIDGQQIQRGNLVELVRSTLDIHQLPAEFLELEITEDYIMKQAEHDLSILRQLRDYGIAISIDDFGTGQSSLSYLKHLPVSKLKIDRSFIMDIPQDANDAAITRAIMAMGKSLGLTLIAEGVETEEQETFLRSLECNQVQGFRYSRPVSALDFEKLLVS